MGKMGWGGRREGLGSGFRVGTGIWGSKALCKMPPCSLQTPGEATTAQGHVPRGWDLPGTRCIQAGGAAPLERWGLVQATPSSEALSVLGPALLSPLPLCPPPPTAAPLTGHYIKARVGHPWGFPSPSCLSAPTWEIWGGRAGAPTARDDPPADSRDDGCPGSPCRTPRRPGRCVTVDVVSIKTSLTSSSSFFSPAFAGRGAGRGAVPTLRSPAGPVTLCFDGCFAPRDAIFGGFSNFEV